MDEHRTEQRHRVLKSGRIIMGIKAVKIDCMIRDLSVKGARVKIPSSTFGVPAEFMLAVGEAPPRPCRVIHRSISDVGVQFF